MALVGVNNLNSENKLGGLRNDTTSFTASNINSASLNTTSTQNMTGTNSLSVNASTESFDVFSSTTGNGNLQNTSNSAATTTTSGDLNMNHTLGNNQTQSTPNSQELYSEAPSTSTNNSTTQQPSGVSATSNTNSTTASNNYSQSNQGSNLTSSTNNMTGGTGTNSQGSIGGNVVNTGSTGSFQATSSMVSGTQATMNTGSGLSYANNTQAYNTGATSVTSASTSLTTSGNVSVSTEEYELMIEDFRKQLRNIGIKDYDIDRVINGELTLEELWNEIYNETSNDPKSTTKRDILEATTIHALNESLPEIDLNYNSIAEMNQEIDRLTREIEAARKEEMYQEISEADATRRLIEYMSSMGEDLEESLDNCTIAYKCRNENGDIVYFYGELGRIGTDLEVLEEISYRDMYGNSESCKKMYELVPKRTETYKDGFLGLWGDEKTREVQNLTWTQEQEDFYYKLGEQVMSEGYHDYFTDSEEVQKLLEERETLEYLRDYIDTELDYYLENIDPYINASDFEEKNEFDSKYEKIVSGINQGGYSVDYPKYIDDKEEMIAILSCLFNGSENIYGDVIYTYDSEGKISGAFSYTSGDDIFNHFKDNWGEILTDEEKEIFNYIVNTKGAEAAYEYLETIAPTLDQRWLETERLKDKEWAEKHPVLASIGSILITPFEGLSAACYSLNSLITGADLWRTDVYSRGDQWRSSVSAAIATDHPVWAFAYDTFMSMADTGALIALTTLTGGTATPLLSAVTMGSRAYVSSLNDALDRGVENNTAIAYAFGSATIETLCESYSVGHLMNLEEKVGTNTISFIKKLVPEDSIRAKALYIAAGAVTQGLAEGEEELCTEVLNFFWDQTLCKEKSTFNLTVQSYIASGMSEEEAILNAYKDEAKTCALSFAGGFFSGICFGGFQAGKITRQASLNHMNVFELDTEIRQMDEIRKLLEQTKTPTALAALSSVKTSINNGTLLQDAKTYITTKFNSVQNLETQTQINSETLNNTELERAKAELQSQLQALIDKRGLTFDEYVKQMGQIEGVDSKYKEQIEAKAKEVHQRAVEVEKAVSEMMKSLEVDGAHLEGFSHRYKSEDSIARKIMTRATELGISEATIEEVGNTGIKDSLRYTLILDQSNYSQGVYQSLMKLLDNGYQIVKANNSWGDAIYQGLNIGILDPSGLNIELQFHTEGSFNTKEKLNHAYYEIGRSMYATEEEIKLANEIMQINQQQNVETINSMVGLDLAGILNNVELERAKAELQSQLQALIDKRGLTFDEYVKQMGQIEGVDPAYKDKIEAKAREVHQRAVDAEPAVSAMMKSLEVDGAHLEGFDHRYKSESSIARKIMTKAQSLKLSDATIEEVGNTGIKDSLRYTLILDQSNYSQGVYQSLMKLIDNGYQIVKANNSWGDAIYQGLNIGILDPSGLNIELQFHTEGSFNTKEKLNHAYYEIGRSMYATEEEIKLANEIMQINQQQNVETINSMVGLDLAGILNNVELERAKTQLDSTANLGGLFNRVSKVQEQRNIASENYLQSVSYLNYPLLELNGYNQKSIEIANYRAQQGLRSVIVVNSTTDLDTYITRNLIRPELVSIKIPGALYKGKYSKQKYQSRMTYNAYEAQQIMERLTYILNTVDRSKSQVEQAYQVYSELGKYIRICREYEKIATQLQSDPASLQSFWDSVQGLRALIPNRFTGDATAICAGYSAVYYEIMKHLGIRCDYIRGTVTSDWSNGRPGGHAWNVIIAEDQLIPVDVTWFTSGGGNWFGGSTDFNISRVADQDETYKNFSTPYRPKYVAPQVQRQENIRQTENYGARVYKRNDGSYFTLSMLGHRTVNNTTLYKYAYSEWGPNGWNNARIIYTEIDVDKLPQQAQSGFINSLLLDSRVNQKVASNNGYIGYVDFNGKKYINESIIRFFAGYTKNYVDSNGLAVTVRKDLGPNVYQYYKFINDNGRTILNSIIVSSN